MATLYSLNVRWVKTDPNTKIVEDVLNRAGDWFRFDAWAWLLVSDYPAHQLSEALRSVLASEDSIFIIQADPNNYGGYAPPVMWEWLSKYRPAGLSGLSGLNALGANSGGLSNALTGRGAVPPPKNGMLGGRIPGKR
jgi:hypothetical protein